MAFFFDEKPTVRAKWTSRNSYSDANDSIVLIGENVWHSLTPDCSNQEVSFSIMPELSQDLQRRLLCYGRLDKELDPLIIVVPQLWITSYSHIFESSPSRVLHISQTSPSPLTLVIVVALSDEAYNRAQNLSLLHNSLFTRILRQGDIFTVNDGRMALNYRLEMLEPVLQGYATLEKTEVLLLSMPMQVALEPPALETYKNQDAIEIDEGFLANSVLSSGFEQTSATQEPGTRPIIWKPRATDPITLRYRTKYLNAPRSLIDDHCTLYLRAAELGKVGLLSGDWAVAGVQTPLSRLVRVVANDDDTDSPASLVGSPLLLHNILGDENEPHFSNQIPVFICPSPFGSSSPTIPIAKSITIARVASPISTNRQYQALFLDGLKAYFDSGRRLVKQNDLLAISIDTDLSRWPLESEGVDGTSRPGCASRPNEVVFFRVTNIEYDVMSRPTSSTQDAYTGSTLGELGCWVDSSVTRMVQTGIDHTRVPDVRSYMQIDTTSPLSRLVALGSSNLLGPQSPFSKLLALASAAFSQRAVDYRLILTFLLRGGRSTGKFTLATWVAQRLGLHLFEVDCYTILGDTDMKTEGTLRVRFEQARSVSPCILVLRHLEAFSQTTQAQEAGKESAIVNVIRDLLDDLQVSWKVTGYPVIVVGTTSESSRISAGLLSFFKQDINLEAPNEGERLDILKCLLVGQSVASDVSLKNIATQTAALLAGDLRDLVGRAKGASIERTKSRPGLEQDFYSQVPLSAADFDIALGKARDSYSESIGAPKIPTVSWDDVGGLAHVKTDILDTIQLPLERPELFSDGLKKRSGILLYGPPGTGKTLIAKAVATSCSLNFFSVKGPELLNMYIGESEANVRRVFQRARDAKPCVIFFDELDSVAPKRGNHGDSGGVMDRIVSQLLAELDGMSGSKGGADVFVIGATNRPDLLDPALLRPGRFDRMLYLGVSDTHEAQLNILEALTRKFRLDSGLNLCTVAEKCPFNYTGADFYALCSDAMLNAMSRKAEGIEEKISVLNSAPPPHSHPHPITPQYYLAELASPEDIAVHVSAEDFDRALKALVPSVSQAEMEHYAQVQQRFSQKKDDGNALS